MNLNMYITLLLKNIDWSEVLKDKVLYDKED